jgi:hypothetical protein
MIRNFALVLTLVTVLAVGVIPALAQTENCILTWTEDEINQSYRVTNPARRSVSSVVVDLRPGQVVISATITLPRQQPVATITTLTPYIENGRLFWTVSAVTGDGVSVSDELLTQINAAITASWQNYVRTTGRTGVITAVDITDTEISLTLTH